MPDNKPRTTEEAIWDIHGRIISLETTILGTPNTKDNGLVGEVAEIKKMAVDVRDNAKNISWITARCKAFHGESGNMGAGTYGTIEKGNPLKDVPKGRLVGLLTGVAFVIALAIYNLGGFLGWWPVK
ncbi:MAG: hypothetical protein WC329_01690 [Candidatus Omnitrophota bacterium]|jgi:hypothetical protein